LSYENLKNIAEEEEDLEIHEMNLKGKLKGLYSDKIIVINKNLNNDAAKSCVLAEELGHYHTSSGDILNQSIVSNSKQEKRARNWGYENLIPVDNFIKAYKFGCKNRFELSEFLGVTEQFLEEAINHYKEKHGLFYKIDKYLICFDPLGILEMFEG
jgi:Zn-dependent peptidase ImmA (M78 family)